MWLASDLIKQAQDRHKRAVDAWKENYDKSRADLRFMSDDPFAQWDENDYNNRVSTRRPALTIDQLGQFIHQVANDIRINTPTINVIPSKDGDVATAEIYKGLIKNIEYASNADVAYDTASLYSIRCGIGFMRIDHDYTDDDSFDQDLMIRRIVNPLSVTLDPDSIEPDGSDAKYATIIENISVKEFKRRFPGKSPVSFDCDDDDQDTRQENEDTILIAEQFFIEETPVTITAGPDGRLMEVEEAPEGFPTRKIKKKTVRRVLMSGADVLEDGIFPGKYIPIVPVYGEEAWIDGKRHLYSLIRKSKDAQRMFNYWASLETELLMKAPKAPIMAAAGTVENYRQDWQDPDKAMVLRYDQVDSKGNPAPPPSRMEPPPVPVGVVNARRQSVDDIKATMGIYNASLGERSNETSGRAIMARKEEGDVATYHFADNLTRSITHVGRILVFAIPEIYDTPRIIRIIGAEDESKSVGINGQISEDQPESVDLRKGKYDVKVVTGASYTTRRQEAAQFFSEIVTRQPELMNIMGDLLFKNMDFSGAQAMAERMKKVIDPKFLEEGGEDPQVAALKVQIEQAGQLLQAAQAEIGALQQQIKDKQADLQIKAQSEQNDAQEAAADNQIKILELRLKEQELQADIQLRTMELQLREKELEIQSSQQAQQIAAMKAQSAGNQAAVNIGN
ncbi:MAG: hypothetical protein E6R03_01340 [Hyphomicrobiaceae bacterium]|nr:MAG: hypothetical protein E6R03_01340 [Hyphomicrobiaceae bacterium]